MKKNKLIILMLTLILLIICINVDKVYAYEKPKRKILILNSYHHGYKWSDELIEGINQSLNINENYIIDISVEYMDLKKNYEAMYIDKLLDLYKYKFKYDKFDLIISTDNDAFNFLREFGKELFPKTPVVFCGVNCFEDSMLENHPNFTGILANPDIKDTIDLAISLHPNTKNVALILNDFSNTNKDISDNVIEQLKKHYGDSINFKIINNNNFSNVKKEVKKLPENSIIFIGSDFKDYDSRYISLNEGVSILSNISTNPIYTTWDFALGDGVVGGKMLSSLEHGRLAGEVALRILTGEDPLDIRVENFNNRSRYKFDYKQLERFGIDQDDLPKNSVIINKSKLFYNIPKKVMLMGIMSIIIGLTIVILVLLLNISEKKEAEGALRAKEKLLSTVLNASPDIICFKDGEGRWMETNKACINFFGIDNLNYKGKTSLQLAKEAEQYKYELVKNEFEDEVIWGSGNIERIEFETHGNKAQSRIFDLIMVPVFNPDNSRNGLLYLARDITEKKKALYLKKKEEESRRKLNEMMEYDKLRVEFFANISHELRTPLNVILGALQLIELIWAQGNISENEDKIGNYINIMKQNSYRLVRIVDNLIDITKIDAGYFKLELKNENIVKVVEDITLSIKEYIESKDLNLIFDTNVEEKIMAFDSDKIERIMLNLLSNSVKFTPKGGSIYVSVEDCDDIVLISVEDTGIGIPKDKQKFIFDRFIQVDKSFTRKSEGSGIGLSLVKSLVEMHNGNITLESEYEKGSKFIIELPADTIKEDEKSNYDGDKIIENRVNKINIEFSDIYS